MMLESEKEIDAAQSIVWSVTEDIERWPLWTPTVKEVTRLDDGPFDAGSAARIKQPGLPAVVWRVTKLTQGEALAWTTQLPGIRIVATHTLLPSGSGTMNILRLEVCGILAVLLWPLIRISAGKALEQENVGLKAKCEAIAKPS
jgi:hypothetical protein